eukprot:CAMPEP_0182532598 /NCGR_PEP_ID=MMETSP1323-20130603/11961_1 /TAXON_ID=236787 /ORGANISM="Florenciella parvula, Strain RCC1693" /LENGTH=100 /DNA_ID=CAMNT_0024742375 /DNA_START=41 /DNA_END=340 /DNA_ORIENTATION=-
MYAETRTKGGIFHPLLHQLVPQMGSYAAAAPSLLLRRRIATTPATTRANAAPTTARVALSLPASPVTPAAAIEVAAVAQFGDETMGWPSVSVCSARSSSS